MLFMTKDMKIPYNDESATIDQTMYNMDFLTALDDSVRI